MRSSILRSTSRVAIAFAAIAVVTAGCQDSGSPTASSTTTAAVTTTTAAATTTAATTTRTTSTTTVTDDGTAPPYPDRTDCQAADESYVNQLDLSFEDTNYSLVDAFQAESASGVVYIAGTAENRDPSVSTNGVWLIKGGGYYTLPGDAGTLTPGFVDGSAVLNASLDDPEARNVIECNANAVWRHGR